MTNLVDYALTAAPELLPPPSASALAVPPRIAVAGVGSVGTSLLALLGTALGVGGSGARLAVDLALIDNDGIDPGRNPFRYPALLGQETGLKTAYFADRLNIMGVRARSEPVTVAEWACRQERPGFDGLLISSVDTLGGRLDVTDALARSTLSLGVAGLELHAQRERFADGFACTRHCPESWPA
ncbi:hypothetical protein ACOBQX_07925 [Actinokineospora sp. G85]|uniref:hypothetical protein n=1 Tax=Actinokineospora sp. G85 TaxID=3406626 RepID=UPI003C72DBE5